MVGPKPGDLRFEDDTDSFEDNKISFEDDTVTVNKQHYSIKQEKKYRTTTNIKMQSKFVRGCYHACCVINNKCSVRYAGSI